MIQLVSDRRKTTGISQRITDTSTDRCWKKIVILKSMSHSTPFWSVFIRSTKAPDVQDKKEHGWTGKTGSTTDADTSLILSILSIRVLPSRRSIIDT